jgi:hypothetical protein
MKCVTSGILMILLITTSLGGCATKTQTGAGIGAATGVAAGAVLGAILGGKKGAAIGAGAGAIVGAAVGAGVGKYFDDKTERNRAQSVQAVAYTPERGNVILMGDSFVAPTPARPGDEVRVKVSYDLLAPKAGQNIPVTERWEVLYQGQPVANPIVRPVQQKTQGGYSSTFKFTVNKDFLPGQYEVVTTISNGETERQVNSKVQVTT